MRIYFKKDKKEFIKLIFMKGYNKDTLSMEIGKCRQYVHQVLKNGTLGAKPAKEIAETLNVDFDELFEIR